MWKHFPSQQNSVANFSLALVGQIVIQTKHTDKSLLDKSWLL